MKACRLVLDAELGLGLPRVSTGIDVADHYVFGSRP
jgi:hypothetical protein